MVRFGWIPMRPAIRLEKSWPMRETGKSGSDEEIAAVLALELVHRLCVQGELRRPGRQARSESEAEFMGEYLRPHICRRIEAATLKDRLRGWWKRTVNLLAHGRESPRGSA